MGASNGSNSFLGPSYPQAYDCEILRELPNGTVQHFYYPGGATRGGRDGVMVKVRPDAGYQWVGTFAFGNLRKKHRFAELHVKTLLPK